MPYHRHRKKRPSRLRCLKHLYWSAISGTIMLAYTSFIDAMCDLFKSLTHQGTCPSAAMPHPIYWLLIVMFVYGLVAFIHRAYRDIYKDDLLWDFPGN